MTSTMTCDQFDLLFPDWLEAEVDEATRATVEAHLASCARCVALANEVGAIIAAAGTLPDLQPERDLWSGIAGRIGSPVLSITTGEIAAAPSALHAAPTRRSLRWWQPALAAAAAAAIVLAGAASFATRGDPTTSIATTDAPRTTSVAPVQVAANQADAATVTDSTVGGTGAGASASAATGARPMARAAVASGRGSVALAAAPARTPAEIVAESYARDIALLVTMMEQQRTRLDTATVAVIERNFQIIDQAIDESRRALERDPASRLLTHQLDAALATKLDLLRRVVLLSSGS